MDNLYLTGTNQLSFIDKKNWTRVSVSIQDKEGNKFQVAEIVGNLVNYIRKEIEKEKSAVVNQVYPIMTQMMYPILLSIGNEAYANLLLNGELIKNTILDSMTVSFLLLKYLQQKELLIVTTTEKLMDSEIQIIKNHSEEVSQASPLTQLLGVSPQELLYSLIQSGQLSNSDINQIMKDNKSD